MQHLFHHLERGIQLDRSSGKGEASTNRPVLLAVAPNGARRSTTDHPALPITPDELAATATACLEAGAAMIHLHVRDSAGAHCLDAGLYRDAIRSVRAAVGDRMIIQITTEAVGRYGPEEQMAVVEEVRPEAVSLALRELCPDAMREPAFAAFLGFLDRERIAAQFILYDVGDVARLADLFGRGMVPGVSPPVLYVLGRYAASGRSAPADLLPFLSAAADRFPDFMVCAFGPDEAACGVAAARLGGDVRVGFENNLYLPEGTIAPNNAALVAAVAGPLQNLGRRTATADAVRARWRIG
jgi:uncharacterized protein (DUF849 family)